MRFLVLVLPVFAALMMVGCQSETHSDAKQKALAKVSSVSAEPYSDIDLSGVWTWSIDPYEDGYFGFHGGPAGTGHLRYDVQDVGETTASDPIALYEYDMRLEKTAQIPGAWLGHSPEMRHYNGLVWYQRSFDLQPSTKEGERVFLEFGAVNYSADVYLNGKNLGKHEGGFTPFTF